MISLEQLFSLLLGCAVTGSSGNMGTACATPEMTKVPYEPMEVDQRLPDFDEGHWYTFEYPNSKQTRLEILIADGKVLQAGVEIVYVETAHEVAKHDFQAVARLADRHYGSGSSIDMGGIQNFNYGNSQSVFYVINTVANNHPVVVFRAGNREFWP